MKLCLKLIPIAAIIATLSSCEKRELCYDHSHTVDLDVRYDWSLAPDASPESMSLYMFPYSESSNTTGKGQRYEIIGMDGETIRVNAGEYSAITFNSDQDGLKYLGLDSEGQFEIATIDGNLLGDLGSMSGTNNSDIPRAEGTEDQRVARQPPMMWAHYIPRITIFPQDPDDTAPNQAIEFNPQPIVDTYKIHLTNIVNLRILQSVSAAITGMASGTKVRHAFTGRSNVLSRTSTEVATIPFDLVINKSDNSISGEMTTFGHCADGDTHKHYLMIYAILIDNSKAFINIDISDKINSTDNNLTHDISIDRITIPEPDNDPGGFNPSVDDWGDVNINIPM